MSGKPHVKKSGAASPSSNISPIPYGFLHVQAEHAIYDAPVWRDGSNTEPRYSGELLITLKALTPLIVGNHQHKDSPTQSTLEPQMLEDGRVLLGAASLKGMLRSAMSSLLRAPMERVSEHHYTYRPNLGFGRKREPRAAVVLHIEGDGPDATITIKLLPRACSVVFIKDGAKNQLGKHRLGQVIQGKVNNVVLTGSAPRMRLQQAQNTTTNLNHYYFRYCGGQDGQGLLAQAFSKHSHVYQNVLVPAKQYDSHDAQQIDIPSAVLRAYYQTQGILANDQYGHLSPGHPLKGKLNALADTQHAIKKSAKLNINQLIYVEIATAATGAPTVCSMGHHFYYRWGYTSSVRYRNRLLNGQEQLRPALALHPKECADHAGAPQQLTASRLLFGYALDGQVAEHAPLANGHFKRLAGRITFNTAIEAPDGKSLAQRFVDGGKPIQLHILGMPRPSAVECYLKQTELPQKLVTYGDLPADAGGDLAGRKFYRHQPSAKHDARCYKSDPDANNTPDERGPSVQWLSAPDSLFRATLRFDSLRPWELGALLTALEPGLIEPIFGLPPSKYGYAHKLGYGKPLGLGSVQLTVDAARWQENDTWQWRQATRNQTPWKELQDSCLAALEAKLRSTWGNTADADVDAWRKPLRWADQGRACYPTVDGTIFNFHTELRRQHASVRRSDTSKNSFQDLKTRLDANP